MRETIRIPVEEVLPTSGAVLEAQGIPPERGPGARTLQLSLEAIALFAEKAEPAGLLLEISRDEFLSVYDGRGRNDPESPVGPITRASDSLVLFAVTVGEPVCSEISRLFRHDDFAQGLMLDAAASEGAERAARSLEDLHRRRLQDAGRLDSRHGILRFSPGFCGWDISAQRTLFDSLEPGDIGITLNESFLMRPLKSISGVIVAGKREIFEFDDVFSFCADCATHECRDRIRALGRS